MSQVTVAAADCPARGGDDVSHTVLAWNGISWQVPFRVEVDVVAGAQVYPTGYVFVRSSARIPGSPTPMATSVTTLR